ncbi:MAG: hypothetical protein U1E34_04340 [Amaricoccus sp.]
MHAVSDMTSLRATLRALAGRFGRGEPIETADTPGLALYGEEFARDTASSDWETGIAEAHEEAAAQDLCRRAAAEQRRLGRLRANAHAAYESVQGSRHAALDLALSVYEAELRDLRAQCDAHAEMLKTIRLYARDGETRALAAKGLDCCAEVLAARQLAEAGCPRETGFHS